MRQKQVSSALPPFIVLGGCLTQEIGVFDQDIGRTWVINMVCTNTENMGKIRGYLVN